jgi:hypothetical protein
MEELKQELGCGFIDFDSACRSPRGFLLRSWVGFDGGVEAGAWVWIH